MNLSHYFSHSLFAPFLPHLKAASWPTYQSMSYEAVLKFDKKMHQKSNVRNDGIGS